MTTPLLEAHNLVKHFPSRAAFARHEPPIRAVDGISLAVGPGETLGIVGESGCGKSTLARMLARLLDPTAGRILFDGVELTWAGNRQLRGFRRAVQMVFQDPFSSLNPRRTVGAILAEPLAIHGIGSGREERRRRVAELMERVGLDPGGVHRYPHELSGGQRQRVGVARALAPGPRLIIADEPVSALDVSVQAQVLGLLGELQRELDLALILIAHDLAVVRHLCHRVAVMYLGQVVEVGGSQQVLASPSHPYTGALLASAPVPEPRPARRPPALAGEVPSPAAPPSGCRFHPRCPKCGSPCRSQVPPLEEKPGGTRAACHFPLDDQERLARLPYSSST